MHILEYDTIENNLENKFKAYPSMLEYILSHQMSMKRYLAENYKNISDQSYILGDYTKTNGGEWNPQGITLLYLLLKNFIKDNENKKEELLDFIIKNPFAGVMLGKKGGGKTAFSLWLAEQIHEYIKIYSFTPPNPNLPEYINCVSDWKDVDNNSFVIYDEAQINLFSRNFMKKENKDMTAILSISRHRDLRLLFITQHVDTIDINIVKLADCFFVKQMQLIHSMDTENMRRSTLFKFMSRMQPKSKEETLVTNGDFWYQIKTDLPTFWTDTISKSHSRITLEDAIKIAKKSNLKTASEEKGAQLQRKFEAMGVDWDDLLEKLEGEGYFDE